MSLREWFYNYCAERDFLYDRTNSESIKLSFWFRNEFVSRNFDSVEDAKQFVDVVSKKKS